MNLEILSQTYPNLRKLEQWLTGNQAAELWSLHSGKRHVFVYHVWGLLLVVTVTEGRSSNLAGWEVYRPVSESFTADATLRDLTAYVTPQPRPPRPDGRGRPASLPNVA